MNEYVHYLLMFSSCFVGSFIGVQLAGWLVLKFFHKNDAVAAYRRYLSNCSIDKVIEEIYKNK